MPTDKGPAPTRYTTWIFVFGPPSKALRTQLARAVKRDYCDWVLWTLPARKGD